MAIKIRQSGNSKASSGLNTIEAIDTDVQKSVDTYAILGRQIKDLQAQRDEAAGVIKQFSLTQWAKNLIKGVIENFKVEGKNETVTFQVQNRTRTIGQTEYDNFSKKFGEKAANNCLEIDYGSVQLNAEVFKNPAHAKKVEQALEKLAKELGCEVVGPAVYKVQDGFFNKLRDNVKTAEQAVEAIEILGVVNFPQSK